MRIRMRTFLRSGLVPGQPYAPVLDPDRIEHTDVQPHFCGECFGPRRENNMGRLFCEQCLSRLFGSRMAYDSFIRGMRARETMRRARLRAKGLIP